MRVVYDGTNGVFLNVGIRIRDQIRLPTAPDPKAVISELADEGGSYSMLMYDIKKAHRRIPVLESEWGHQACRSEGPQQLRRRRGGPVRSDRRPGRRRRARDWPQ